MGESLREIPFPLLDELELRRRDAPEGGAIAHLRRRALPALERDADLGPEILHDLLNGLGGVDGGRHAQEHDRGDDVREDAGVFGPGTLVQPQKTDLRGRSWMRTRMCMGDCPA